jgi:hypothetical protein
MLVHKKVIVNGVEYEHYQIKKIEWDLDTLNIGVVVIYYDNQNKFGSRIKTHYFNLGDEIDVNDLIEKVKIIHGENIL